MQVHKKTATSLMCLTWVTAVIETAEITNKLNEADPTMAAGPRTDGTASRSITVLKHDKRISGMLEPRAIRVRLATVGFHTSRVTSSILLGSAGSGT